MSVFFPVHTPDGQTFSLLALNIRSDRNNTFIQLYPKELDLEVNKLFVETVLTECNATAVADPQAPNFAREIQVKGEYILAALATLFEQGYIDEDTFNSLEARLGDAPAEQQALPQAMRAAPVVVEAPIVILAPLTERLAAFVEETQDLLPQVYANRLFPILLEYTGSIPLKEIIEMAKSYFPNAWIKTAIEALPEKINTQELLEKLCPQSLEDYPALALQQNDMALGRAVEQLEALAAKQRASHQEVLDDLTLVLISLSSHEGILPDELKARVETAVNKISTLIPPFDFNDIAQLQIKAEIEEISTRLMPKLGVNITCAVEMETDFDRELALLLARQEEEEVQHQQALLLALQEEDGLNGD